MRFSYADGVRDYDVNKPFEGIIRNLERRFKETESEWGARGDRPLHVGDAPAKPAAARGSGPRRCAVKIDMSTIAQVTSLSVRDAHRWFEALPDRLDDKRNEIAKRHPQGDPRPALLPGRRRVGLPQPSIRASGTLSGGESQRIRLASQIGSGLTGVLYVLDEPSIGLHQRDNERLLDTLRRLRDLGNSVIVVEHDEDAIRTADWVVDVGPGAGIHGGEIVSQGTAAQVMADPIRSPGST